MKRNPQLPHWGWTATTGILRHSTTAPNHFLWPLKRRIRKPGFALSSQEEGIKVKYQWPGVGKGLVYSFYCCFLSQVISWAWAVQGLTDFCISIFRGCILSEDDVWLTYCRFTENTLKCCVCLSHNMEFSGKPQEIIARRLFYRCE